MEGGEEGRGKEEETKDVGKGNGESREGKGIEKTYKARMDR